LKQPGEINEELTSLSKLSSVIRGLKAVNQIRIYVPSEKREECRSKVEALVKERGIEA
jgi:hypothetical protein